MRVTILHRTVILSKISVSVIVQYFVVLGVEQDDTEHSSVLLSIFSTQF